MTPERSGAPVIPLTRRTLHHASGADVSLPAFEARHIRNGSAARTRPYGPEERAVLSREAFDEARAEITSWLGYAPTPLVSLPGLAARLGIRGLAYKDESGRFGLKSFKALGGAYAVLRLLQDHVRRHHGLDVSARELMSGDGRQRRPDREC